MLGYVVRFFQRYAHFFAMLAGVIAYRLILPGDSPRWLEATVACLVVLAVWKLLYKDGVTGFRANGKTGPTILAIAGYSLCYWYLVALVLFLVTGDDCESVAEGLAFDRCISSRNATLIISSWIAMLIYAFLLWRAIRARRHPSNSSTEHSVIGTGADGEMLVHDTASLAEAGYLASKMADNGVADIQILNANGVRVSLEKAWEAFRQSSPAGRSFR